MKTTGWDVERDAFVDRAAAIRVMGRLLMEDPSLHPLTLVAIDAESDMVVGPDEGEYETTDRPLVWQIEAAGSDLYWNEGTFAWCEIE